MSPDYFVTYLPDRSTSPGTNFDFPVEATANSFLAMGVVAVAGRANYSSLTSDSLPETR